jgi:chemotaxis protein MotA
MLATVIAIPIADKLTLRKTEEGRIKAMCLDGLLAIQEGLNPRVIEAMLKTYLTPKQRAKNSDSDEAGQAEAG